MPYHPSEIFSTHVALLWFCAAIMLHHAMHTIISNSFPSTFSNLVQCSHDMQWPNFSKILTMDAQWLAWFMSECDNICIISLPPSDAIWHQRSWYTWVYIMADCMMTQSHHSLNQCLPWWWHWMEILSVMLVLCEGNSLVTAHKGPVMNRWSF